MVERGSEEPTRNLRAGPGRVPGSDEPTRDLRRDVLRRLGPPPVRGPVPGPPRPLPAPVPLPAGGGASVGRVVLIVVGVLVGLVFLGVAGVGLYAVLGGGSSGGSGGDGAATAGMSAGDCVAVSADGKGSVVAPAPCGGAAANFRVVDVVAAGAGCPGDVNLSYPLTGDAAAQTACLDVDWVVRDCFELSGTYPQRVDCTAPPGQQTVRVVDVDRTGAETAKCPSGSGLPYPQRRFVVCLDPV